MKEFLSSFLLITSWLIFAISGYLFIWTIFFVYAIVPAFLSLAVGLFCFYCSKKLDSNIKKNS
ncbi:hypothetical protein CW755_09675 [Geobacillus thermodenitrificans]|uniref:Uncharacterized protein n=1 Tax=Parageobacillus galactosidasius TaxID=883812 RepID=A0A226QQD1_9BACL|nr:hypothetical protein [Geobacillus thermodenitrificans]NNU88713.1 hypothetical protein [Geobacillus sp. MR]OQO99287.1 hypothetical protein B1689_13425 [Geobacillus sp. 44C]OXB94224.1 hypothetical protein B9L23_04835 [Parageobacillus galactosidasius]RDE27858.1 hypothetical protein DV714_07965 [Parageobacillus thermoglucosidasius]